MLELNAAQAPAIRPPLVQMAKWPPDDGDVARAGNGYPGGLGDPGGGDFKKGKVKPFVALGLVALVAAGAALFLGVNTQLDKEQITPEKVAQLTAQTLMLSKQEQLPKWEAWARDPEGNVMGLMPHPEHAVDPLVGSTDGAFILGSLIDAARKSLAVPAAV